MKRQWITGLVFPTSYTSRSQTCLTAFETSTHSFFDSNQQLHYSRFTQNDIITTALPKLYPNAVLPMALRQIYPKAIFKTALPYVYSNYLLPTVLPRFTQIPYYQLHCLRFT
jgi:hypothetical protein